MCLYRSRVAGSCLVAIAAVLSIVDVGAWGADEFVAPPQAEREAVAALTKKGARLNIDADYRVTDVVLMSGFTNDELRLLAACERLTGLQLSSPQITDAGIDHLKALTKLTRLTISGSGLTETALADLRAMSPNLRITNIGGTRGAPGDPPPGATRGPPGANVGGRGGSGNPGPGPTASRGTTIGGPFGGPPGTFGAIPPGPASPGNLVTNPTVQEDLKLTAEQREQIRAASDYNAFIRARDEKAMALLSDEQRSRLKQIELQQAGITAVVQDDVAKKLNLTDDQRAIFRKAIDEAATNLNTATTEIRRQDPSPGQVAKVREKTVEMNKERDERIQSLLNDEQRKVWLAMLGPKGPDIFTISRGFPTAMPEAVARSAFKRTDTDRDGKVSETEFATIPEATRQRIKDAGVSFEFPVSREDFEKGYAKYIQSRSAVPPAGGPGNSGPSRTTTPPTATVPSRAMPGDVKAYNDARQIREPEKKIEALEKFLADFPASFYVTTVKRELVQTLIKTFASQKEELLKQFDKLIAAVTESTKSDLFNTLAWELYLASVHLDEAERFASQSIALMNEQKFIEEQTNAAKSRNQPIPPTDELKKRFRASRANVEDTLGKIWLRQGKTAEGEKLLKEAFEANPTMSETAVALADLALKRGEDTRALDYLSSAVAVGRSSTGTREKLETLYARMHKDSVPGSLDKMLDDYYRKLYPTLSVAHYKPTPERSDRTVLAEVFTGSACPPCVGADLAFDAMLERYSRKDQIVLMYHQHIPGPDPMANPSTQARWKYYPENRGVPSYLVDGERIAGGGGSREMALGFYDRVNPAIEQRLEAAAEAKLNLSAALEGMQVKVKADVSQVKGSATDIKLQLALVEEMLSYSGENGIRLHPVVVRSLAGEGEGGFAIDAAKPEAVECTFDIAKVTEELKAHLDDFESKAPGGRKFSQKKHEIDPSNLSVVAFVQDQTTKRILQAAYVRLNAAGVAVNQ